MKFIFAFFLLFSGFAFGENSPVTISNSKSFTVGTSFTQFLPQNTNRQYLIIYNAGSANVCVGFGVYASASTCIPIPPLGNYEPYKTPLDALFMVSGSAGQNVIVWEGQ